MFHAKRLFTYATILGTLASVADAGPPSVTAPMPSFDWFDLSQLGPLPGLALPESGCVVVAYVAGHDLKEPWLQRIAPLCKDGAAPPGPVHVLAQMVGIPEPDPKTAPGLGKVVVYSGFPREGDLVNLVTVPDLKARLADEAPGDMTSSEGKRFLYDKLEFPNPYTVGANDMSWAL